MTPRGSERSIGEGRYRLLRPLGAGEMSVVYLAEQVELAERVAIKILDDDKLLVLEDEARRAAVSRFAREANGTAQLRHPHVVEVRDVGETEDGAPFFVMEHLDGEHLGRALAREGPMPWPRVAKLARQIASALAAAHALGVVHRDLKPENCVRVTRDGDLDFVKLIDFGVASFSAGAGEPDPPSDDGRLFGTPQYLAPEAIEGRSPDHRVDVYALGVIMFELLTGQVPFDEPGLAELLAAHRYDPVPALVPAHPGVELPAGAEALVRTALAKQPERRFADMGGLIAAIDALAIEHEGGTPLAEPPAGVGARARGLWSRMLRAFGSRGSRRRHGSPDQADARGDVDVGPSSS